MNEPVAPSSPRLRLRLRPTLALVVGASTACIVAAGAWLATRYFEQGLIQSAEQASALDGDEIRGVFEEEMLLGTERGRSAVPRLVHDVASAPGVRWVGVLDVHGTVKISSDGERLLTRFPEGSPEGRSLAAWRDRGGGRTSVMLQPSATLLRTLTPFPKAEACSRCHLGAPQVIGMLIIDRSLEPIRSTMARARLHVAVASIVGIALLMGILGLSIERIVLRRINGLREAARRLGSGNLAARTREGGFDEIGDLARDFDEMAGRLESALVGQATQRRQLEDLVNGISDGIIVLDPLRRVITSNRAFAARAKGHIAPGTGYPELLRAAGVEAEAGTVPPGERALASGKLETQVLAAAGGERVEEVYAQPLHDADGRVSGVVEVWRDITGRRALEASLERSERLAALGVLASSVAHEVGNPLASIITAVDGLLGRISDCPDPTAREVRDYLEMVRKQVFRCRTVTQRLLGFSRVPGEEPAVVDVAGAAANVLALVQPQAAKQGVRTDLRSAGVALTLAPDMLLEQVFLNIVLNALNAMPRGGDLRVEVAQGEDGAAVSFCDTGGGIPERVMSSLFEPFRRARNDGTGTGLGLFISRSLVERVGGTIDVRSRPGEGTTLTVHLRPLAEAGQGGRAVEVRS